MNVREHKILLPLHSYTAYAMQSLSFSYIPSLFRDHLFSLKGAMSAVAHALASENKLEKDGPSFSSSVGDFGRLFLAVEISAIVR